MEAEYVCQGCDSDVPGGMHGCVGDQKAVAAFGAGHRYFLGYDCCGHQIRCRGLPEKEVMASEVDALCLMCRVKLPPMCTGPSVSSASGLEVGLAYWAWLLLLACVGDRCGGKLAALGGLW